MNQFLDYLTINESLDSAVEYQVTDQSNFPSEIYASFETENGAYVISLMETKNAGTYMLEVGRTGTKGGKVIWWRFHDKSDIMPVLSTVLKFAEGMIPMLGAKMQGIVVRFRPNAALNIDRGVKIAQRMAKKSFITTFKLVDVEQPEADENESVNSKNRYLFIVKKAAPLSKVFGGKTFNKYGFKNSVTTDALEELETKKVQKQTLKVVPIEQTQVDGEEAIVATGENNSAADEVIKYTKKRIEGWFKDAKEMYGAEGRFISMTYDATNSNFKIKVEEEGEGVITMGMFWTEELGEEIDFVYNVWMERMVDKNYDAEKIDQEEAVENGPEFQPTPREYKEKLMSGNVSTLSYNELTDKMISFKQNGYYEMAHEGKLQKFYFTNDELGAAEDIISNSATNSTRYAKYGLKGAFPKAENVISMILLTAVEYAVNVVNKRWGKSVETKIKKETGYWKVYSEHFNIQDETKLFSWEDLEEEYGTIKNSIFAFDVIERFAFQNDTDKDGVKLDPNVKAFLLDEFISKNPKYTTLYAKNIVNGPVPEMEGVFEGEIFDYEYYAVYYATKIKGDRLSDKAESLLMSHSKSWKEYIEAFPSAKKDKPEANVDIRFTKTSMVVDNVRRKVIMRLKEDQTIEISPNGKPLFDFAIRDKIIHLIQNDSDSMTDYFSHDSITLIPSHPLYNKVYPFVSGGTKKKPIDTYEPEVDAEEFQNSLTYTNANLNTINESKLTSYWEGDPEMATHSPYQTESFAKLKENEKDLFNATANHKYLTDVWTYSGSKYVAINKELNRYNLKKGGSLNYTTTNILKMFHQLPSSNSDMVVFRNFRLIHSKAAKLVEGYLFYQKSFTSTSIKGGVFVKPGDSKKMAVRMKVLIPKNSRIIPLFEHSQHKSEAEVLLPPMSSFRIIKVDASKNNTIMVTAVYEGSDFEKILKPPMNESEQRKLRLLSALNENELDQPSEEREDYHVSDMNLEASEEIFEYLHN